MTAKTCEICNERTAMYLCQNCGSSICPVCRTGWLCKKCATTEPTTPEPFQPLRIGPIPLLAIAITIILAGIILVLLGTTTSGTDSAGCFFWPFPLIVSCGVGTSGPLIAGAFFLLFIVAIIAFWLLSTRWARVAD